MASRGNGNNTRGGGRGRGRGQSPGRGGRGWRGPSTPTRGSGGRGTWRGGPRNLQYNNLDLIDVEIQRYSNESSRNSSPAPRGANWNRGRGRGRPPSVQNFMTFRPNGRAPPPRPLDPDMADRPPERRTERKVSRGIGAKYTENMSLSAMLALDKPYLRPIQFVKAQMTPVLFKDEEELIHVEPFIEPEDHVPTAAQVTRVFSHQNPNDTIFHNPQQDLLLLAENDTEPIETIDFNSIGEFMKADESKPVANNSHTLGQSIFNEIKAALSDVEQEAPKAIPTGHENIVQITTAMTATTIDPPTANLDNHVQPIEETDSAHPSVEMEVTMHRPTKNNGNGPDTLQASDVSLFVIDPDPSPESSSTLNAHITGVFQSDQPLGSQLPDDEIIVYDAPHPRSGRATPNPSTENTHIATSPALKDSNANAVASSSKTATGGVFNDMSFSFTEVSRATEANKERNTTPRSRRLTKKDRHSARKAGRFKKSSFGMAGAMLEELHLHDDEDDDNKQDRRHGSDIDWGDESDEEAPPAGSDVDKISNDLGDMVIDSDANLASMESFVKSMSVEGMIHRRIDDTDGEDDIDSVDESEKDSELDAMVAAEEELLVAEDDEGAEEMIDEDEDSSDEELSPNSSFQARLERARQIARRKGKETAYGKTEKPLFQKRILKLRHAHDDSFIEVPGSDEDDFEEGYSKAEETEDFFADIQDILDENDDILTGRDRKQRKMMLSFNAIRDGEFSVSPAKKKRDYGKDLPHELQEQWEKDRAKKADNKAKRAAARLAAALNPETQLRSGKKAQKALLRAARLAEEADSVLANEPKRAVDVPSLIDDIRAFIANRNGGPDHLALPPMDKTSRKIVHEVAVCFELTSKSKGKEDARFITLHKRARTGLKVNERKLSRILREWGGAAFARPGGRRGGGGGAPKHREGDEVGKEAPKIGESNIGFKMLAGMGWVEGERIGVSGGLDAPITAIIKHTKLGLGATRA